MTDSAEKPQTSVKETLTSVMISFIVALVFRGFVIEGFQIPTGSMGPTLLGAHLDIHSEVSGYDWPLETWHQTNRHPDPVQTGIDPHDPITGIQLPADNYPTRSGDRVFVFKYLEPFHGPERWDVTVFKVPIRTSENYIKRMIGVPNEQLALVDGDVFTRPLGNEPAGWNDPGWKIQRKPERVQRSVWQTVFDSTYAPEQSATFRSPWVVDTPGWEGLDAGPSYAFTNSTPTTLQWKNEVQRLDDYLPFNEMPSVVGQHWNRKPPLPVYPVSDIALAFGYEPGAGTGTVSIVLTTRGHDFRATLTRDGKTCTAVIDLRAAGDPDSQWHQLQVVEVPDHILAANRVTNIEFWHVDQALWLWADGKLIAGGPEHGAYDWDIAERINMATAGRIDAAELDADQEGHISLEKPDLYVTPSLQCRFSGSSFRLHRVRVKRDLFYRPAHFETTDWPGGPEAAFGRPALATHPASPLMLGPDRFFMCGDNSPRSLDGRVWGGPHPIVADKFGSQVGTVHRDELIGRAFVVYFPSPRRRFHLPVLDFGHIRWIW